MCDVIVIVEPNPKLRQRVQKDLIRQGYVETTHVPTDAKVCQRTWLGHQLQFARSLYKDR